ncbi:zinc-binding dehydrogenase [Amycolatopsis ultiminotia]|uniref:Zinc-binding dehydrogenase n=1 Tax=Amycolatopsis ultiminotia TaxID=543629 RepID=A0ABP6XW00_9PSEU
MPHNETRAIVVDHLAPERLAVHRVQLPAPEPGEITIRVSAVSLNRGETKRAVTTSEPGTRPGWDFTGVVEDDLGVANAPKAGTRVVGIVSEGAWAERIHVPVSSVAVVPDEISDAQAAGLPMVGLTALHALRKGGSLLGRAVLIDGSTGGIGQTAIQLAAASGARVHAHVRNDKDVAMVAALGAEEVIVGATLEAARPHGPFDFVLDSLGGSALSAAMTMLARRGTCVTIGMTESPDVHFDNSKFVFSRGASLQGMVVFDELAAEHPADGLALLLGLVARGLLKPAIAVEAPWTDVAEIARDLLAGRIQGKAILHLGD